MRTRTVPFRVLTLTAALATSLTALSGTASSRSVAGSAADRAAPTIDVAEPEELAVVAGIADEDQNDPNTTPENWAIEGTDLGIQWTDSQGRTAVMFGDTYGDWGGSGGGGEDWRFNTLAHSTDENLEDGLSFDSMVEDSPGHAGELLGGDPNVEETTVIPTAGVSVGDRDYVHYMSVRQWGEPGHWETNYGGLAHSDDGGETWTKDPEATWPNGTPGPDRFQLGAFWKRGDFVYLIGTPNGRHGDAHLARVSKNDVGNVGAYEYWDGEAWHQDPATAAPIFSGPVGELSVQYNTKLDTWVAMYLDEGQGAIVMRTADEITGPWSQTQVVVPGDRYAGTYGPFLHPSSADSDTAYFTLSEWETYRVHLLKVQLDG